MVKASRTKTRGDEKETPALLLAFIHKTQNLFQTTSRHPTPSRATRVLPQPQHCHVPAPPDLSFPRCGRGCGNRQGVASPHAPTSPSAVVPGSPFPSLPSPGWALAFARPLTAMTFCISPAAIRRAQARLGARREAPTRHLPKKEGLPSTRNAKRATVPPKTPAHVAASATQSTAACCDAPVRRQGSFCAPFAFGA
jgi:hypothetical protein